MVSRTERIKARYKRYRPRPTIERARTKYRPKTIDWLLIAEAPPVATNRFFYFETVRRGDSLFLETVRVLFKEATDATAAQIRESKKTYLEAFKGRGFYLIDVCDKPIASAAERNSQIRAAAYFLEDKLDELRSAGCLTAETKIILISRTVHDHCYFLLRDAGFNVVNREVLPFPGSGHQKRYRKNLATALRAYGCPASA